MSCSARMTVSVISMVATRRITECYIENLLNATIPIQPAVLVRGDEHLRLLPPQYQHLHGQGHSLCILHAHQWCTVRCVSFVSRHHLVRGLCWPSCARSASPPRHSKSFRSCGLSCLGFSNQHLPHTCDRRWTYFEVGVLTGNEMSLMCSQSQTLTSIAKMLPCIYMWPR